MKITAHARKFTALLLVATLVVSAGAAGVALGATTTEVSVSPETDAIGVGETTTFDIVVGTTEGVGASDVDVELTNPSVASITEVSIAGDPGFSNTDVAEDGSAATFQAVYGNNAIEGDSPTIATVTVEGTAEGQTGIDLTSVDISDEPGASYTVSGTNGATLTVEANDAPTADAGPDQSVDESAQVVLNGAASSDADGTIASYSWTQTAGPSVSLSDATSATPEFTAPDVDGETTLTFEVEVTDDDGATDTDTVSITVADTDEEQPPAGTVDVSLSPAAETVSAGDQTTFDVVVSNVDGGVGAMDLTVSSSDAGTVEIVSIDSPAATDTEDATVAADGSSATIVAYGLDTDDSGSVAVATVTVEGAAVGTGDLSVDVTAIGTESGTNYQVGQTSGASVEVIALPALDDSYAGPPQDLDGDGVYEDVNGDGVLDASDVQALFVNRNSDAVTQNQDLFDVNGDGGFDIVDVQALFNEVFN